MEWRRTGILHPERFCPPSSVRKVFFARVGYWQDDVPSQFPSLPRLQCCYEKRFYSWAAVYNRARNAGALNDDSFVETARRN
jgi:hypothetical protein